MTSIGHNAVKRVNILNQTLKLGFSKKTNGRVKLLYGEATDPRLIFSKTFNKWKVSRNLNSLSLSLSEGELNDVKIGKCYEQTGDTFSS